MVFSVNRIVYFSHRIMEVMTYSAAETMSLGETLAVGILPPLVIALIGDLGSGKTHLVKGLARGLGINRIVTSPTFVMRRDYACNQGGIKNLYHIDAYRLNSVAAAESIGLSDVLADPRGVVVIEWAERISGLLPRRRLVVTFEHFGEKQRRIMLSSH